MSLGFLFAAFGLFLYVSIQADRRCGRGTSYLINTAWCAGWGLFDVIVTQYVPGIIINGIFAAIWYYFYRKFGPKDQFKRLKKAIGAKTKLLIAKMTGFVKAGQRARPKPAFLPA